VRMQRLSVFGVHVGHVSSWAAARQGAFLKPLGSACGALDRRYFAAKLKPAIRDPERPTRPKTAWIEFLQDFRQQSPGMKPKEVMESASQKWKQLPASDKSKYERPYEEAKKAYDAAMEAYVKSGKKEAWERDPARPRAPATPYLRFAQEFRQSAPSLKMTEATKLAAEKWKDMDAAAKLRFEQDYAAEKERYAKELKEYQESGKEEEWKKKVGITAQEEEENAKKKAAQEKKDKLKLAEKAKKEKEKEKAIKLKEAEKAKKEKEKAKEKERKMKEAEKKKKEKEKEKAKREKDKEKAAKEKAKTSFRA